MHFIRGRVNAQYSDLQAMHHLANGQNETLSSKSREANKMTAKPLSQLKLKKGSLSQPLSEKENNLPYWRGYAEVGDKLLVTTLLPNITKIYDLIERVKMNKSMIRYLLSKLLLIEAVLPSPC